MCERRYHPGIDVFGISDRDVISADPIRVVEGAVQEGSGLVSRRACQLILKDM
jgi:hypothetical protein